MRRAALALTACLLALPAGASARPPGSPLPPASPRLGSHSMIFLNTPAPVQRRAARLAREAGMAFIRRDVSLPFIFDQPGKAPRWKLLDQALHIDRQAGLQTVAVLTDTAWWNARCPDHETPFPKWQRCPPADWGLWAQMISTIAAHAPDVRYWQIGNEPDFRPAPLEGFWYGTAEDYAAALWHGGRAIRAASPSAKVVFGGSLFPDQAWLHTVMSGAGYDNRASFDIADVHRRPRKIENATVAAAESLAMFRAEGFAGPLWITETGYPSSPRFQQDSRYRGTGRRSGEYQQARFLRDALRRFWAGGVQTVFLSGRDVANAGDARSGLGSEAFLAWPAAGGAEPKQAWRMLRRMAFAGQLPSR